MTKEHLKEASLVDLTDDDLKELIGSTYTKLRNLEEQRRVDSAILKLKDEITELLQPYKDKIRSCKACLKAARYVAQARGLRWRDLIIKGHNEAP